MTKPVVQELHEFTTTAKSFTAAHHECDNGLLNRFLSSTMDEARLRFADRYAAGVLERYDLEDWVHFRHGVHRREVTGEISFDSQRDHSAHTLNNYLLGAYFWEHATGIRNLLVEHMKRRGIEAGGTAPDAYGFFHLWVMASLLHDIGYLFEGSADPKTTKYSSVMSEIGVDVVREYFNSRFWVACGVTAPAERRALLELAEVAPFELKSSEFSAILESLRDIGDLSHLRSTINHLSRKPVKTDEPPCQERAHLNVPPVHDAFYAWSEHYKEFGLASMVQRIQELERYVFTNIYDGMKNRPNVRVLDHGVCSGLLTLRASTYFYLIWFGLHFSDGRIKNTNNENTRNARDRFLAQYEPSQYTPDWWWRCICWSTAAAALHNHLQMEDIHRTSALLRAEEDPLAYLGVLVDILQEWDRFRVNPNSLGRSEPVQGVDVLLGNANGIVEISYPSSTAKDVCEHLDKSLDDWKNYVKVISIRSDASP